MGALRRASCSGLGAFGRGTAHCRGCLMGCEACVAELRGWVGVGVGGWFWMRVCLFNRLLRSSAFAASLWSTWLLSRRACVRLVVSQW